MDVGRKVNRRLPPGHGSRAFRLILYERLRRFHPYPHAGLDNRPFDIGQFMAAGRHHGLHPDLTLTSDPVRRLRPPGALDDLAPGRRRYRFVWYRPVDGATRSQRCRPTPRPRPFRGNPAALDPPDVIAAP